MSGYPAHKRFACDRCRDQKLRCPRVDINGDEPCARCRRAGALCVTGGARPLGRPRTNSTPAATATSRPHMPRRDRDPAAVSSLTTSSRPTPSRQGRTTTPASATAAPGLSWPTMSTNDYASLLSVPNLSNTASPNLGDASLDMEHFFGMLVPDGDLAPYTPNSPLGGMQDGDANFATELDAIGSPNESMPDADSLRDTRRDTIQRGDGVSETPALASTEALISLSRLNESLSRQLGKINTYPWQAPPLIPGACSAKINSTSDNPVSEALQSTTSFVAILKSLSSTKTAQSPGSWSASDSGISVMGSVSSSGGINSGLGTTTGPALSTATYLLLLSCYLQLMQLYNTMFCRLVEFIGDMPEETISEFQPQTDLRVAGLPVMPNRLYIKVLVQIIDHQLESVERLMGLSAEYRISGRSAPRRGIFSEQDVAGLLQTVMGQADDSSGPGNTVTGKSLVVSLRDNMAKVQEVLRG